MTAAPTQRAPILTVVAALAILLGIAFRFYHLDAHGFWGDEGVTALHVAGYTQDDVTAALTGPQPIEAGSLKSFHVLGSRGVGAVVSSLAREDAQHPPVYYILADWWEMLTGSQVATLRALSAIIALLLIPAIFWLAMELFGSRPVAWTTAAIAALSPFTIEYAQQAREYALWIVLICVSSALLLRNLRSTVSVAWWGAYALSVVLATYAHEFFALVILAHAVYVLVLRRALPRGATPAFWAALAAAFLACLPWFIVSVTQHMGVIRYGNPYAHQSLKDALYAWTVALGTPFVDLEFLNLRYFLAVGLALAIEVVSFIALIRTTRFAQWFFLVCSTASPLLLQLGNGGLTDMPRYLAPSIIGIQIVVGWWLATTIQSATLPSSIRTGALCTLIVMLAFAAFDDGVRAQNEVWWTNIYGAPLRPVAMRIDAAAKPALVIGDAADWEVLDDEAAFLAPNDRVWITNNMAAVHAIVATNVPVYLFSRYPQLARRYSQAFVVDPISVEVPARGYALIALRKRSAQTSTLPFVWLWQLRPKP